MRKRAFLRRAGAVALCLALLTTQTACGGRELYERLLIHGIGVDWDGEAFQVTVRSSSAPGEEGEECFQCQGKTVLEALNSLSLTTGRQPFYAHNYLVIFGDACARHGLDKAMDFFIRYYNTRPAVQLYLAHGTAAELLTAKKDGKYLNVSHLQQLRDAQGDTGRTVTVELLDYFNASRRAGSSPVLPVARLTGEDVQLDGAVFFREDQPAGSLTPEEVRGFLAAKGRLKGGSVALWDESFGGVTLTLSDGGGRLRLAPGSEPPQFTVEVELDADLSAIDGGRERLEPDQYPLVEAALARRIREEIQGALEKTALENGCDIFGFGTLLYQREPDRWETVSGQWPQLMARCGYDLSVTARISRVEN